MKIFGGLYVCFGFVMKRVGEDFVLMKMGIEEDVKERLPMH